MSLLMQALKKAERARQSGLQEEDVPDGGHFPGQDPAQDASQYSGQEAGLEAGLEAEPDTGDYPGRYPARDGGLDRGANAAPDLSAPVAPGRVPPGALELSLEPLDAGQPRAEPPPPPPPPPAIEPAVEASHNPVPPQARHEGGRARGDAADIPVADARAAPRPAGAGADGRRGPGAPERRAVPRGAPVRADAASGVDLPRLRVAGLAGLLVIVAATFGYLYWQAVNGPGPGASLPMVPMPPPSATGATSAGDAGIVVAPSGAPFGAPGTPAPVPDATAAQPLADTAAPPAAPASIGPVRPPAAAPRVARPAAPAGPTPAQLAAIEDPEIRREAMRDAMERMESSQTVAASEGVPEGGAAPLAAAPSGTPSAPEGAPRADVQVARGTSSPTISPAVQAGYAAFAAGDLAAARRHYAIALRDDPNNRDALLGSAVIAARERRDDDAAGLYLRLLATNPRDAEAIAGLTALRPGDGDRAEVRLKGVLRDNPAAAPVHFALGNLYARQRRWQEAQQAYFQAWSAAPSNADYAFNLAVGLDRLNQGRLARDYYERALALAAGGAAAFDRAAVQRRLLELSPAASPATPAAPAPAAAPATAPAAVPVPAALQAPGSTPVPAVGN